jgi:hypothetical protein
MVQVLFFKLEEESAALLLHLLKVFAETAVLFSASGLGCGLVVGVPQVLVVKRIWFWGSVVKK